jgi:hypothetical protein
MVQVTGWLVYDATKPLPPSPPAINYDGKSQNDIKFIPFDMQKPLGPVTKQ